MTEDRSFCNKKETIAWVLNSLNKPAFSISPQQSLLNNKQEKQPAYYDGNYYKSLEWKPYQNWHQLDEGLRDRLIELWHKDRRIEGVSTLGGWNGKHWLCWVDFDRKDFESDSSIAIAIVNWCDSYPILKQAPHFTTPNGGHRFLVALEQEPTGFGANNGFSLRENSSLRNGELLTRNGGSTILPPTLGANGKRYEWIKFVEYPPIVGCPADIGIYPLVAKKSTNNGNSNYRSSNYDRHADSIHLPVSDTIPLEICLAPNTRELINIGETEGARDNTAAQIARDLLGTQEYLIGIGQQFEGDALQLLEEFCYRCNPPLGDRDVDRIWRSAVKANPTPCLLPEQIKGCIAAYLWREYNNSQFTILGGALSRRRFPPSGSPLNSQLKNDLQSGSRVNGGAQRNGNSDGNTKTRSVEEDIKFLDRSQLLAYMDRLSNLSLPKSDLRLEINNLAKRSGLSTTETFKLYREYTEELESVDLREELIESTKQELELLLEANKARLRVEDYFEETLTHPIVQLAQWLNVRPEVFFTALLTGISSLHHPQTKTVLVKSWDFEVTPNLFGAIVAPSSQKKSPIIKAMITKPMRFLHAKRKEAHEQALVDYENQLEQYEALKRSRDEDAQERLREEFPEGKPKVPRQKIHYFTSATGEGILSQVSAHPDQGLLYLKDELAGVFKSANQYRQGRGSDEEDLLSYYDGTGGTVLRSAGVTADLEGLLLAIFGSIQPKVLLKMLGDGEDSNGNWARFIFVLQPAIASTLEEDSGQGDLSGLLAWLYERIADLPPQNYRPDKEAFQLFKTAYNRYEQMRVHTNTPSSMAHVWGKNEGRVGKLATNIHVINSVLRGEIPTTEIGIESIKAAIAFTEFYTLQVQAIYSQLSGLLEDSNSRSYSQEIIPSHLAKVLEVAARKGDWITSREVIHSLSSKQQKTAKADVVRSWFVSLSQMDKGILDGDGRKLRFKATNVSNSVSSFVSQSKSSQSNDSNSIVSNVINVSDTQNQFTIHSSQFTIEEVPQGLEDAARPADVGRSRLPTSFKESAKDANNANKVNESHEEQVFEGANNTTNKAANKLETANKEYDLKLHIGDRVRDFFTNWCGTVLELMPDRARIRWDYDRRVTDRLLDVLQKIKDDG